MNQRQIQASRENIEGLETILVGPLENEEPAKAVVILLHGFGASGADLVPCAPEMIPLDEK